VSELQTALPDFDENEIIVAAPEITFQITFHDTSMVLEQLKVPKSITASFLLSRSQRDLNWETLTRSIFNPHGPDEGVILDGIDEDQTVCFTKLQSHSSYYLYYFSEDKETKQRSQIQRSEIETKPVNLSPNVSYELFNAEFLQTMASVCIPAFMIYFTSLFLQKMDQVPDECFSFNTTSHPEICETDDDHKHEIPKTFDVNSKSFFKLFHRINNTGRQEEEENVSCGPSKIEDENQELEDRRVCGICCQRSRDIIFLNCGHAYCCYVCSLSLTLCPIDQKPICARMRFSKSRNYETECYSNELAASFFSSNKVSEEKGSDTEMIVKLQNSFIKKLMKCIVCNQREKDTFFLDCGHMICCSFCAKNLTSCPFDSIPITKVYQAYFP